MDYAEKISEEVNNYKDGKVTCKCGWSKELGDGFCTTIIANCPSCTPELKVRHQRKVIYWDKSQKSLRADIGDNVYFSIRGGIHVRYSKRVDRVEYGSERKLDRL